jgi:hypothetical protein
MENASCLKLIQHLLIVVGDKEVTTAFDIRATKVAASSLLPPFLSPLSCSRVQSCVCECIHEGVLHLFPHLPLWMELGTPETLGTISQAIQGRTQFRLQPFYWSIFMVIR